MNILRKLFCVLALSLTFHASASLASTATFVSADVTTKGSWMGVYGADGHAIEGVSGSVTPSYATWSVANELTWTWTGNTTDVRALQASSSLREATCWYNTSFTISANVGSSTHQIAIYIVDWDSQGRAETVQVTDSVSGTVLDTRQITNFTGGEYLLYSVTGSINIKVTENSGPNAVVSGIFFDTPGVVVVTPPPPPPNCPTPVHSVSLGWPAQTNATGYNVYRNSVKVASAITLLQYNDITVVAGEKYTYGLSYIVGGVESPQVTIAVTIPTP